ncbi:MAG: hypothetical protein C0514_01770 [Candidatus Puniceispirillum sp.]|nr:hypothetical protein [Candidatus Puniceispirillum sp.]
MLALFLSFAQATGATSLQDAQGPEEERVCAHRISPFQEPQNQLQAARDAFAASPTSHTFNNCIERLNDLFKMMLCGNECDISSCWAGEVDCFTKFACECQARALAAVPHEVRASYLADRYLLGSPALSEEEKQRRIHVCASYIHSTGSVCELFATQNLVHEMLASHVNDLRQERQAKHADQVWSAFEEVTKPHNIGENLASYFWEIPKPLQELLLVTNGESTHPQWIPCMARALEGPHANVVWRALHSSGWQALLSMDKLHRSQSLAFLASTYDKIRVESTQNRDAMMAMQAFDRHAEYYAAYKTISDFFWTVERTVLDTMLSQPNFTLQSNESFHTGLSSLWANAGLSVDERPRELLMLALDALLVRRFSLTAMSCHRDMSGDAMHPNSATSCS